MKIIRSSSVLLRAPELPSLQLDTFFSGYHAGTSDMGALIEALSGKTQTMLVLTKRHGFASETDFREILESSLSDYEYGWKGTPGAAQLINEMMQSTLLLLEAMHGYGCLPHPDSTDCVRHVQSVVIGEGRRQNWSHALFTSEAEIYPIAGEAAYVATVSPHSDASKHLLATTEFRDRASRIHLGKVIGSPLIADFVHENPHLGQQVAEFTLERQLWHTDKGAQSVVDHFMDTALTRAVGDGWL